MDRYFNLFDSQHGLVQDNFLSFSDFDRNADEIKTRGHANRNAAREQY